jgi:two-component system, LuxR family, sensor kinase FixL
MPTTAIAWSLLLSPAARKVAGQSLLAIFALAVVTLACAWYQPAEPQLTTAALLYLVIVVFLSLNGSFTAAIMVSIIAVVFLQDLAAPPLFSLSFNEPLDLVALISFLTTALVITRLVSRMRGSLERLRTSLEELGRAEKATRQQAALLDLTHDTVLVRDTQEVITFWNRGAQELYGWSAAQAVGRVAHTLLHTKFPVPLAEITQQLRRTGRWEGELIHTRLDNSEVVVASRWSLQRNEAAIPIATLETNNDITAHKQSQDALLQAQTELARITRVTTLGELAASIAHEVNQPLTAIVADANAALNWLAMADPNLEVVRETLTAIVKDSERAAEILTRIRGMLTRSSQPFQSCDLGLVIRETLPLVRSEFTRHSVRVEFDLSADLPLVLGDFILLQQVLLNLLVNAAEASREVDPARRVVTVGTLLQNDNARLSSVVQVRDAGIGIRATDRSRLFEAFYTTKPEGLGMGLSISNAILERHGGRLWVTANLDHGVTFHFSIPALVS